MRTTVAETRSQRKVRTGTVISNKMMKTIVVRVSRQFRHPKYSRVMTQASAFKVHDETNSAAVGDLVKIMETRPLSKDKRWRLVEIVRRASTAPPLPDQPAEDIHAAHKTSKRATSEAPAS
jgi:small subunit ribosomal protein S17